MLLLDNLPGRFMKKEDAIKQYLTSIASKGGKARAKKYDKATLSKWGKKGGRPPKKGRTR
jgi:general stress protein YciG